MATTVTITALFKLSDRFDHAKCHWRIYSRLRQKVREDREMRLKLLTKGQNSLKLSAGEGIVVDAVELMTALAKAAPQAIRRLCLAERRLPTM